MLAQLAHDVAAALAAATGDDDPHRRTPPSAKVWRAGRVNSQKRVQGHRAPTCPILRTLEETGHETHDNASGIARISPRAQPITEARMTEPDELEFHEHISRPFLPGRPRGPGSSSAPRSCSWSGRRGHGRLAVPVRPEHRRIAGTGRVRRPAGVATHERRSRDARLRRPRLRRFGGFGFGRGGPTSASVASRSPRSTART